MVNRLVGLLDILVRDIPPDEMVAGLQNDVVDGENSSESSIAIHYREAPHSPATERFQRAMHVIAFHAGEQLARHHVEDAHVRWFSIPRPQGDADIAIGNDANHVSAVSYHGKKSALVLVHQEVKRDMGVTRLVSDWIQDI